MLCPQELGLRGANLWVLPTDSEYEYKGLALNDRDKNLEGDPWKGVGEDDEVGAALEMPTCAGYRAYSSRHVRTSPPTTPRARIHTLSGLLLLPASPCLSPNQSLAG